MAQQQAGPALNIAAAQINTTTGDVAGNLRRIMRRWVQAERQGADLVVTPELSLSGYPLEDLVENPDLLAACEKALAHLVRQSRRMSAGILVGLPYRPDGAGKAFNQTVLIEAGKITGVVRKRHLPNYDVFDEQRNFQQADTQAAPLSFRGRKLGVLICEDGWHQDVAAELAARGAELLIAVNASPFETGKVERRIKDVAGARVAETGLPLLYVNQSGGQDEIVFDGGSFALNGNGDKIYQAPLFTDCLDMLRIGAGQPAAFQAARCVPLPGRLAQIWCALVTGTRDYLAKIGKEDVVLGMSGGIDSAVVAAIAADALGPSHVHLVSMPYKYSAAATRSDARTAAGMLGAPFEELPIKAGVEGLQQALGPYFNARSATSANENDQARIRGTMLMHISNEKHWLVLSTGNKSEVSVGYCTLYGDMNGGFNPLKDVPKTLVFELARWRNQNFAQGLRGPNGPVMPDSIITRPPSAELAPGQQDEASLPPYELLDPLLQMYVVEQRPIANIAKALEKQARPLIVAGRYPSTLALVEDIVRKTDQAEFKRQQACPGVKITQRSFGRGRRLPVARPNLAQMNKDIDGLRGPLI